MRVPRDIILGLFEALFFPCPWDITIPFQSVDVVLQIPICFPILFGLQDKTQIVSGNYLVPWNGAVMEAEAKR
jgi:hypothetical protein